jgi:fumarate hydratase class II
MHIATLLEIQGHMLPRLGDLIDAVWSKAKQWVDVVKIGRTHLQDAVPLTVGTAVSTGLNAPDGFGDAIAAKLAELTGLPLTNAPNRFAAQGSLDAMVAASARLRGVAVALMKIANNMRWLVSGPRAGLHELKLPANEPGSSIMPGKVNPTQQEEMVMVCLQAERVSETRRPDARVRP